MSVWTWQGGLSTRSAFNSTNKINYPVFWDLFDSFGKCLVFIGPRPAMRWVSSNRHQLCFRIHLPVYFVSCEAYPKMHFPQECESWLVTLVVQLGCCCVFFFLYYSIGIFWPCCFIIWHKSQIRVSLADADAANDNSIWEAYCNWYRLW